MPELIHYRILIAYEGTEYCGWQVQPNGLSVQEVLERVLTRIFQEAIKITGAGRTDAGVHALGQVAHFAASQQIDLHSCLRSLNALLPPAIAVLKIQKVTADFHARFSAERKIYRYHIWRNRILSPFQRRYVWHCFTALDFALLQEAAQLCVGFHDFSAFANQGGSQQNPVKNLMRIDLLDQGDEWVLEFEGDGFLYKMVRNLVGTFVDIARGQMPVHAIPEIIASKDRKQAGRAAPPQGLFMVTVQYSLSWEDDTR